MGHLIAPSLVSTGISILAVRRGHDPTPRDAGRGQINLMLYYGGLGARAAWRPRVDLSLALERPGDIGGSDTRAKPERAPASVHPRTNRLWAELIQRSFGLRSRGPRRAFCARWGGGVLACPRCGGRLRLIAHIEEAQAIQRILGHPYCARGDARCKLWASWALRSYNGSSVKPRTGRKGH